MVRPRKAQPSGASCVFENEQDGGAVLQLVPLGQDEALPPVQVLAAAQLCTRVVPASESVAQRLSTMPFSLPPATDGPTHSTQPIAFPFDERRQAATAAQQPAADGLPAQ